MEGLPREALREHLIDRLRDPEKFLSGYTEAQIRFAETYRDESEDYVVHGLLEEDHIRLLRAIAPFGDSNIAFGLILGNAFKELCRLTKSIGFVDAPFLLLICYIWAGYNLEDAILLVELGARHARANAIDWLGKLLGIRAAGADVG